MNSRKHILTFTVTQGGERIDRWLAMALPDRSRAEIQRWIKEGHVRVDGISPKASYKVRPGDTVIVQIPPPLPAMALPEPIPLDILYEDNDLLVINKPAGMVVHPAPGRVHRTGTLVNAVLAHVPDLVIGGEQRPGIVHRLDKDTSGVILVAKNDAALRDLQAQFKARTVEKAYLALVEGELPTTHGRIEAPIGRDPRHRQRMAVVPEHRGRSAVTEFLVLERFSGYTLIEARPRTGRTHQIRVHLTSIGHPLVGDPVYGRKHPRLHCPRQFLHAFRIGVRLPSSGMWAEFTAPLPADLEEVLERLRRERKLG
ncbi:MAG: RluA family pseudouridine synthase [Anaerolineae bacterium]|nr:RluA family pseudouridine synthase [Anaerolineae bacterium]MDW8100253.1 RluA family pseudouridine synthase [Anaerolineae bacterium]